MASLFDEIKKRFPSGANFEPGDDLWEYYFRFPQAFEPDSVSKGKQEIEFRAKGGTEKRENISTVEVEFKLSVENCRNLLSEMEGIMETLEGKCTRLQYYAYKPWMEGERPFWLKGLIKNSEYMVWGEDLKEEGADIGVFLAEIAGKRGGLYYSGILEISFIAFDTSHIPESLITTGLETCTEKRSVLLVDDNETTLNLLQMILKTEFEESEIDFIPCSSGQEAFGIALQHRPNLILLDIMMPEKDGLEVLMELKQHPHTKDIPVVMVSAKANEETINEAKNLGAAKYLVKPFVPFDITRVIRDMLFEAL